MGIFRKTISAKPATAKGGFKFAQASSVKKQQQPKVTKRKPSGAEKAARAGYLPG